MATASSVAVILAAGAGTRMRSRRPKVLHEVGGRPMLGHVIAAVRAADFDEIAVVVGDGAEQVAAFVDGEDGRLATFVQAEQLGTAHAVLAARPALAAGPVAVVVLCGDAPLIPAERLAAIRARLETGSDLVVLGFEARDPSGYGRILIEDGAPTAIREEKDASATERAITLCNSGVIGLGGARALDLLEAVGNDNAKREFYLTDVVALARARGLTTALEMAIEEEVVGVNDRVQLAAAEALFQRRAREAAMRAGATLIDPASVTFSADTVLGEDVVVEPNVVFGPGVTVGEGARIHAFCHIAETRIAAGAAVGPFARLRGGAEIGEKAKIGNFVEVKNSRVGVGAKASHLTYVGDADVGAAANLGAGTITCNYDGTAKHRTVIGEAAFIGSNSALVAPVAIGARAYIGSGSVITEDVPADALAIARGRQVVKPDRSPAAAPDAAVRSRQRADGGSADERAASTADTSAQAAET